MVMEASLGGQIGVITVKMDQPFFDGACQAMGLLLNAGKALTQIVFDVYALIGV